MRTGSDSGVVGQRTLDIIRSGRHAQSLANCLGLDVKSWDSQSICLCCKLIGQDSDKNFSLLKRTHSMNAGSDKTGGHCQ